MPWRASSVMQEKLRFILEYERVEVTFTELCHRHESSRETGYVWQRRYPPARRSRFWCPTIDDCRAPKAELPFVSHLPVSCCISAGVRLLWTGDERNRPPGHSVAHRRVEQRDPNVGASDPAPVAPSSSDLTIRTLPWTPLPRVHRGQGKVRTSTCGRHSRIPYSLPTGR